MGDPYKPSRLDLPGLLLALNAIEEAANPKEALQALIVEAASAQEPEAIAWLVEFETLTDGVYVPEKHLVFEKPEGPYLDCATALIEAPWMEAKPLNWDYTN